MLVSVAARECLLRMVDALVHVALHRPVAARGVRGEPTARVHGEVGRLLHRLHREIAGRLDDDSPLPTDPGDDRWPVLVIMPTPGLALLAAPTRSAPQGLLPTLRRLPLVARSVREVIRFDGARQLALHLMGRVPLH